MDAARWYSFMERMVLVMGEVWDSPGFPTHLCQLVQMLTAANRPVLPLLFVTRGHGLDLSSGPPQMRVSEVDGANLWNKHVLLHNLKSAPAGLSAAAPNRLDGAGPTT